MQDEGSNPFVWFGGVALALVLAVGTAMLIVVLFGGGDDGAPLEAEATPTAPALAAGTTVYAEPSDTSRTVARLDARAEIRVVGRLDDGSWLAVEAASQPGFVGWVRAALVEGLVSASSLPIVAGPPTGTPSPTPTTVPDDADLAIEEVFSSENQVVVTLTNLGGADITTAIVVTVGGGDPHRIDVSEKPLRPGDHIDAALDGEYIQRRASIEIEATAEDAVDADPENNVLTLTLGPDVPNDLEIASITVNPYLQVEVRNNSPIPIVGAISVAVRQTQPSNQLLGRRDELPVIIEAGASTMVPFDGLQGLDATRIQAILATSAINDAVPANDTFPR
ncbi:MAG: hypothetical protein R3C39_03270 [Dehalococcoidia bacterium]